MQAAQHLRVAAPGGAADLPDAAAKEPPHLVLVTPFGHRLKAARERSGISLATIAERTKVSASLLAGLERGDVSRWPKGIFRRAFFREYVVAIGLPAEPWVSEFLRLYPDGEDHPIAATAGAAEDTPALRLTLAPPPGISRDRLRLAAVDLSLVATGAAALAWWFDGSLSMAAAAVGLGYTLRVMDTVRGLAAARRYRRKVDESAQGGRQLSALLTSRRAAVREAAPAAQG